MGFSRESCVRQLTVDRPESVRDTRKSGVTTGARKGAAPTDSGKCARSKARFSLEKTSANRREVRVGGGVAVCGITQSLEVITRRKVQRNASLSLTAMRSDHTVGRFP